MEHLKFIKILSGNLTDIILVITFTIIGILFKLFKNINVNNKSRPIIILIHGTKLPLIGWTAAQIYLWSKNIESKVINYELLNSIELSVKSVVDQINIIKQNNKYNRQIILIGHSQGGLIARQIYNQYKYLNIKKVFILNSPQLGYKILEKKYKAIYDMYYRSPYMRQYRSICKDRETYMVGSYLDFNDMKSSLWGQDDQKKKYKCYLGHNNSLINPFLWYNFIIPNL
jgi:pimeloyl-ACP methyl ester carboxylesterase